MTKKQQQYNTHTHNEQSQKMLEISQKKIQLSRVSKAASEKNVGEKTCDGRILSVSWKNSYNTFLV